MKEFQLMCIAILLLCIIGHLFILCDQSKQIRIECRIIVDQQQVIIENQNRIYTQLCRIAKLNPIESINGGVTHVTPKQNKIKLKRGDKI